MQKYNNILGRQAVKKVQIFPHVELLFYTNLVNLILCNFSKFSLSLSLSLYIYIYIYIYIFVCVVFSILNILYPCIMPLNIPEKPISHFNKWPHNFTMVADTSFVRHTSRYRRTETTVSLERGVCSSAELQACACYRGRNDAYQATRAISTTWKIELPSSFFFPARQVAKGNSWHPNRYIKGTCTFFF